MNKLIPCPKCYSEDSKTINVVDNDPRIVIDFWRIRCLDCGLEGGSFDTEEQAIRAWNTRTPDPRLKEAIEEIRMTAVSKKYDDIGEFMADLENPNARCFISAIDVTDILYKHIPEVNIDMSEEVEDE